MSLSHPRFVEALLATVLCLAAATAQDPTKRPTTLDPKVSCTATCHQDLIKAAFVHKPVTEGECIDCHVQEKPTEHTFAEFDDISASCRLCHEIKNEAVVHAPFESMDCTTCHDAHRGNTKELLKAPDKPTLCATCHPAVKASLDKEYVHGPVAAGDCGMCHNAHTAPQPKLLAVEPLELCGKCHSELTDRMDDAESVHAPATADCLPCHDVHGSDREHQVKADLPGLCLGCHKPLADALAASKTPHGAINTARSCLSCHRPHESKHPKLLEKAGKDGCVECHMQPLERAGGGAKVAAIGAQLPSMKVLHGPIQQGECTPCHQPHVSPNPELLQKAFPAKFYAPFDAANYELCFSCHDKKAFELQQTTDATGFRNGEVNLHFLHVNDKQKGRSCRACHVLHGGELPKLLAEHVSFGNWQLPVRWQQLPSGGSCATGCHKPQTYDRDAAARPAIQPAK